MLQDKCRLILVEMISCQKQHKCPYVCDYLGCTSNRTLADIFHTNRSFGLIATENHLENSFVINIFGMDTHVFLSGEFLETLGIEDFASKKNYGRERGIQMLIIRLHDANS